MATSDGKLYITISDSRGSGGFGIGGSGLGQTGVGGSSRIANAGFGNEPSNELTKEEQFALHEAIHFLKAETMKVINYQISTYGQRSGDYIAQYNMQRAMGLASKGIGLGMSTYAGWKLSGGSPIGAAIGFGVGFLLSGTSTLQELENYKRSIRIQNNEISLLRTRAGLDSLVDGSRGTEN